MKTQIRGRHSHHGHQISPELSPDLQQMCKIRPVDQDNVP